MLEKSLKSATRYFISDVLTQDISLCDKDLDGHAYVAQIKVKTNAQYIVDFFIGKKGLHKMSSLFLYDHHPQEETLRDLTKEVANIIAGRAKTVALEDGYSFDISTPTFIGESEISRGDFAINFIFENDVFSIVGNKDG